MHIAPTTGDTMTFYADHVLPHLINLAMRNRRLLPSRERTIGAARGRVLEIGIGSGLNLPFYGQGVERVVGLDPSPRLLAMAGRIAPRARVPIEFLEASAQAIPLDDASVDTVVTTWSLCTIPDPIGALREMRRVLAAGGELLFVEHGLAPEPSVRWWQDRLTPAWRRIGGGCHLNRPIRSLIETAGFRITQIETDYIQGPKPMTFLYEGRATP